jgi:hypothetical protein
MILSAVLTVAYWLALVFEGPQLCLYMWVE